MSHLFDPTSDSITEDQSWLIYQCLGVVSQISGFLMVILMLVWFGVYKGYEWGDDVTKEFSFHPTFMTVGMVYLFGQSALVYRVLRNLTKKTTKYIHLCLNTGILVFFGFALKAVFDSHNYAKDAQGKLKPKPNLMSFHSWIGLTTCILYCLQYIVGFVTFFKPGLRMDLRKKVMVYHQICGISIFLIAAAAALSGVSEKVAWNNTCWLKENKFCGEHIISNLYTTCLVLYVLTTLIIVANPRWRRIDTAPKPSASGSIREVEVEDSSSEGGTLRMNTLSTIERDRTVPEGQNPDLLRQRNQQDAIDLF